MSDKPELKTSYDEAAATFDTHASVSPYNAFADRPTMLSLLPDLDGCRVLDAGCGTGLYCGELLDRKADVVAFDPSGPMVEVARGKYGERAAFSVHGLEDLTRHYDRESFDVVMSALVLDHVPDLQEVFEQVCAVLKPSGYFVCSFSHPFTIYQKYGANYFSGESYDAVFPNVGMTIKGYRRPLEAYVQPLLKMEFQLIDFVETKPIEACKDIDSKAYERMMSKPTMMAVKWRKGLESGEME